MARRIELDAFGAALADTGPALGLVGFAGGLGDPDSGFVRFGVRDYAIDVGRWASKDRIGFAGGASNLFSYGNGNPIGFSDPSGYFAPVAAAGAVFIVAAVFVFAYDAFTISAGAEKEVEWIAPLSAVELSYRDALLHCYAACISGLRRGEVLATGYAQGRELWQSIWVEGSRGDPEEMDYVNNDLGCRFANSAESGADCSQHCYDTLRGNGLYLPEGTPAFPIKAPWVAP